jgi:putative serine protease PepD
MERVRQEAGAGRAVPRRGRRLAVGAVVLIVVAVLVFWVGGRGGDRGRAVAAPSATPTASKTPTTAEVSRRVGPSVVVVRAGASLGSGVVAAENGTILTARHVVKGAKDITVTFSDGTRVKAAVASADPGRDIATLRPAGLPEVLVPATLGGAVGVGAPVVAIGNPLGLTYSVSTGVVSGVNRTTDDGDGAFGGLIQFDASVNPGSSGGPLLDARGLVVGVVVSIADPGHDDAFAGIAFAVPIGAALGGSDGDGPPGPQI